MNDQAVSIAAVSQACKEQFATNVVIDELILEGISVGQSARATLFKTKHGQLLLYIESRGTQVLADVQKMVLRMECEAENYYPPHGEQEYFDRIARDKFKTLFPGKHILGEDDLRYYKGLASYNPALVHLSKIKGEIRGYDEQLKAWRKVKDFHYNKIVAI